MKRRWYEPEDVYERYVGELLSVARHHVFSHSAHAKAVRWVEEEHPSIRRIVDTTKRLRAQIADNQRDLFQKGG